MNENEFTNISFKNKWNKSAYLYKDYNNFEKTKYNHNQKNFNLFSLIKLQNIKF